MIYLRIMKFSAVNLKTFDTCRWRFTGFYNIVLKHRISVENISPPGKIRWCLLSRLAFSLQFSKFIDFVLLCHILLGDLYHVFDKNFLYSIIIDFISFVAIYYVMLILLLTIHYQEHIIKIFC